MKKFLFCMALVFCLLSGISGAHAQLMLGETRIERDVSPSETIVDSFTVHNLSEREMNLKVYWQDFIYMPPFNGKKDFLPVGSTEYSMADWIRFAPQQFSLPPRGEQKINYSIKVPADAEGGYYGVLFFEEVPEGYEEQGTGLTIVTRIGCLFFLETKDKQIRARVTDVQTQATSIVGKISDEGNVFLFPEGIYYILDSEGLVVDRGELEKIYLVPDKQADFQIDIPQDLSTGNYTMVLTFDLGEGQSAVKEIEFSKGELPGIRILDVRD